MSANLTKYYANKTVLVVGGSSGMGLCMAQMLAAANANVIILARGASGLQAACELIGSDKTARISYKCIDVADFANCQTALGELINLHGKIDIVLNCAGRALPDYFVNIKVAQFEQTLRINTLGAINIAKIMVPHFIENGGGQLLNTASVAGFLGVFGYTDYCASKFALVGFSEALQQEVAAYNINVAVLFPPDTNTQGFANEAANKPIETIAISAANKLIQPEVVAAYTLKKLSKRAQKIIPAFDAKVSYYAKRYLPFIVDKIMYRAIAKAQKNNSH